MRQFIEIETNSGSGKQPPKTHEQVMKAELEWLERMVTKRLSNEPNVINLVEAPDIDKSEGSYADLVRTCGFNEYERALLMLLFAKHRRPGIIQMLKTSGHNFCIEETNRSKRLIPTAETFLQIFAEDNYAVRLKLERLFDSQHLFFRENIMHYVDFEEGPGRFEQPLALDSDYADLFLYNEFRVPRYSPEFPANLAESQYTLDQIHFDSGQLEKILEIKIAVEYDDFMRTKLPIGKDLTPGYLALFYGEPGTGKTLTAATLGNLLDMKTFEVNVSNLVSKYIGETTKNLDRLFKKAAGKNWILVFNEADCLFGKRSHAKGDDDAGASHANQVISYLLDAIPRHKGVIILTTNMRQNFDKAFGRRINSEVHFKPLDSRQAAEYLKEYIPKEYPLDKETNLEKMIQKNTNGRGISIASLNNVVHRLTRISILKQTDTMSTADLERCLMDEVYKVGS